MIVMLKAQKAVLSLFQRTETLAGEHLLEYLSTFSEDQYRPVCVDVPMKHSIYNVTKCKGHTYVIYNTLFSSMITLSDTEFRQYEEMTFSDLSLVEILSDNGMIIPDSVDEYQHYMHYKNILNQEMETPTHYTIALTSKCNARCIYCYEDGVIQHDMSERTADVMASALGKSEKEFDITWFGGEPLLKVDLIERISEQLHHYGVKYQSGIITNGSLLTKEMIVQKFPQWNISWIQISIDGMEAEYLKRKCYQCDTAGLYDTLLEHIGVLLEQGISVNIRLNIDDNNSEDCIEAAAYICDRYSDYPNLSVYPAFLSGGICGMTNECERISCSHRIYTLSSPDHQILTNIPKTNSCYFQQKHAFVIDTDGSILCCERDIGRQKTKIGSIYDINCLDELVKPASVLPDVREQCKVCAYFPKCLGGCAAEYSSPSKNDSCFMDKYQIEYLLDQIMDF